MVYGLGELELQVPETEFVISRFPEQMVLSVVIGGAMVAFGLVFIFADRLGRPRKKKLTPRGVFLIVWTGFALSMATLFSSLLLFGQGNLYSDYIHRRYELVEGCLDGFTPSTSAGHTPDQIEVGGQSFSYSDNMVTGGFNTTEISGGPIHADTWVRLFVVRCLIVRVDAIQHACPPAPNRPETEKAAA